MITELELAQMRARTRALESIDKKLGAISETLAGILAWLSTPAEETPTAEETPAASETQPAEQQGEQQGEQAPTEGQGETEPGNDDNPTNTEN